jgi:alpha-ketoglutarate-dependent taurine dioxygenase
LAPGHATRSAVRSAPDGSRGRACVDVAKLGHELATDVPYLIMGGRHGRLDRLDVADLKDMIRRHGLVILRGFRVHTTDFKHLAMTLADRLFPYWKLGRIRHTADDLVQGPDPDTFERPPHSEMAYAPTRPDIVCFWIRLPAPRGGATTITDGADVVASLAPERCADLARRRVKWTLQVPYVTLSRIYGIQTRQDAVRLLPSVMAELRPRFRVRVSCRLRQTHCTVAFTTPALVEAARGLVYADQWATFAASREPGIHLRRTDPGLREHAAAVRAAVEQCTVAPKWHRDDIVLLDNWTVMHGRQEIISARRDVRVCVGYARWLRPRGR